MTQEEKDLLLIDLCARLPYGVKGFYKTPGIEITGLKLTYDIIGNLQYSNNIEFKPYLFPLSSMTEEQEEEWDELFVYPLLERIHPHTRKDDLMLKAESGCASTFWLIKNHFDYLGLIEKGLAIDATDKNIY